MAKSLKGELEVAGLPGRQGERESAHDLPGKPAHPAARGDVPINPPKPQHPLLDLAGDKVAAELAALPVHDGDVPRVNRLVHELQQLTDPGSLYAVKLAAERHLTAVLAAAKAAKDAEAEAAKAEKAAALKAHHSVKTDEKAERLEAERLGRVETVR